MTGIPFGKYQLVKRLARGGMAEVFLARQSGPEGFQRLVAVKRILPHLVDAQDFVRMFLDEARLAAQLSHPNVVHVYDFGRVDEHYFIAMEYVDGVHAGVLIKHSESERLPEVLVARIGADACAGLHYAHELREAEGRMLHIVHRDVSPPNLLVSYDGSVKLVDFGIAKAVSSIEQTRPGVVKGKFAYMSPEQTIGQKLDGRSDVFSLAVVLWELLTGKVLVPRLDPVEGMRMLRDGRLPAIEQERPDIPPALAAAIGHALSTRREERCTALELGRALEEFIKGSSDAIGSPLELAQWVRERFPRENLSGNFPALNDGPGGTRPATGATHTALPVEDAMAKVVDGPAAMQAEAPRASAHPEPAPLPAHATLVGFAEVRSRQKTDDPFMESSSVIVAPGWMLEEDGSRGFDTLSEPGAAETLEAESESVSQAATYDFRRQHLERDRDVARALPADGPEPEVMRLGYRRPESQMLSKAGRIALVIAAGTAMGMGGTLVLRQLRGDAESDPDAEVQVKLVSPPAAPIVRLPAAATQPPAPASAASPPSATAAPESSAKPDAEANAPESSTANPGVDQTAAAPPAFAVVEVVTAPRGARVVLQGRTAARSPARFEGVPPGEYTLRVSLRGYQSIERAFAVASGEYRTVELHLVAERGGGRGDQRRRAEAARASLQPPASGVLKVRTRPYSEVYLDGRRLGQTPLVTELRPGRYSLVFRHPGKADQRRTATVRAGEETKLDFVLE